MAAILAFIGFMLFIGCAIAFGIHMDADRCPKCRSKKILFHYGTPDKGICEVCFEEWEGQSGNREFAQREADRKWNEAQARKKAHTKG